MLKVFAKKILADIWLYILNVLNLVYSIKNDSFDWLLWLSLSLGGASLILNFIQSWVEVRNHAESEEDA